MGTEENLVYHIKWRCKKSEEKEKKQKKAHNHVTKTKVYVLFLSLPEEKITSLINSMTEKK